MVRARQAQTLMLRRGQVQVREMSFPVGVDANDQTSLKHI